MRRRALTGSSAALVVALFCICAGASHAQIHGDPAAALQDAEGVLTRDHARLVILIEELRREQATLTPTQREHLQFLEAWSAAFAGDYPKADRLFRALAEQAADPALSARALAMLVHDGFVSRRYEDAYVAAYRLMADLPAITDLTARREALGEVIQMLNSQQQYDLALKYAQEMKDAFPTGKGRCQAALYEAQTLLHSGRLTSGSPRFRDTIDACKAAGETLYSNALSIDWASFMVDNGQPSQAIDLLRQLAPSVQANGYRAQAAVLQAVLAQAYLAEGNDTQARQAARAALAAGDLGTPGWATQTAYQVLYQMEKKAGHIAAALAYYENYVAREEAAMDDTKARALAYQMVKQEVLAKKLRLDALGKQNKILHLRQELEHKAAETARLYVALLLAAIAFIGLWLYRLKHSQMRFRRMARHDGLTGAYNRHHFLEDSTRVLTRLQKTGAPACLVVLDLDHFKRINDTYGHVAGDEVLKAAAQVVRRELRASDVFGRLGGEEFGILMPSCSSVQGVEIAERVRAALAASSISLDDRAPITVSGCLGLGCTDAFGYTLRHLLTKADAALYQAKRGGRNQVVVATAEVAETG